MHLYTAYGRSALAVLPAFDPLTGTLTLTGAATLSVVLTVEQLRSRYSAGRLLVYVVYASDGTLLVGVYPEDKGAPLSAARKQFLLSTSGAQHVHVLLADLPDGADAWTSQGVRIILKDTTPLAKPATRGYVFGFVTNEPGERDPDYLRDTEFRTGWLVMPEDTFNETRI